MKYSLIDFHSAGKTPNQFRENSINTIEIVMSDLSEQDIKDLKELKKLHKQLIGETGHKYFDLLSQEVSWRNQKISYSELVHLWDCFIIPMCTIEEF